MPLIALTGCYSYWAVEVHAVDAVTQKPISGLRIDADYPRFLEFFPPRLDSQQTNADGIRPTDGLYELFPRRNTVTITVDADADYFLDTPEPSIVKSYPAHTFLSSNEAGFARQVDRRVRAPNKKSLPLEPSH
ncbi:MAG TPA: hypothetical protein VHY37_03840 [Tepidisphaeraceae bacterium]|nr:hypothetical protein [Tepidisphaeraceae bacterium]